MEYLKICAGKMADVWIKLDVLRSPESLPQSLTKASRIACFSPLILSEKLSAKCYRVNGY